MREIKFRAWNNYEKKMFYGIPLVFDGTNVYQVHTPLSPTSYALVEIVGKWVPMQYTGLKDKNGKDIYEGDIVTGFFRNHDCVDYEVKFPVTWHHCGWYVGYVEGKNINITSLEYLREMEVIGNIYENPEIIPN